VEQVGISNTPEISIFQKPGSKDPGFFLPEIRRLLQNTDDPDLTMRTDGRHRGWTQFQEMKAKTPTDYFLSKSCKKM
jgi:hypothetical protein